jgi:Tol biopolymer transport system component
MYLLNLSRDGSQLLVVDLPGTDYVRGLRTKGPLWSLPVVGGSPRRLGDAAGVDAAWSADGKMLVYSVGSDLFLARSDGTESRKLLSVNGSLYDPQFSADGSRLRFTVIQASIAGASSLWEVSVQGTNLLPLLPGWHEPPDECCGKWTADGKYFVFQSQGQIWALPERGGLFRRATGQPVQLTSSPLTLFAPLPSKDGRKLFVAGRTDRGELVRYDRKSGKFASFLSGISADYVAFSKDGQWVAYVAYPEGTLWRSKADGSQRIQLSGPPLHPVMTRWSPDAKQIVFFDDTVGKSNQIYDVSSEGGVPRQLMPGYAQSQVDPNWSPDGSKIVFGSRPSDTNSAIQVLDLASHRISTLPGSHGIFSARWSPDGRYIVAMPSDSSRLVLFDFHTQKWSELAKVAAAFPNWSEDGQYVYFLHWPDNPAVLRAHITDRKVERVVDLRSFSTTGHWGVWMNLAPGDSPMLLRDAGSQDIYALDWEE